MLKLLTCAQGHYWEQAIEDEADGSANHCPQCGQPAETMPLLDLAPSEVAPSARAEPPSPPPLRDKEGRPLVAGYDILQDLGKGPTGIHLYKARQVLVNRSVVLKVVFAKDDPSQFAWGSLRNEATALGRLSHPNIVQVLEAGERERQLFYNAVEHVEGPTLAETLGGKPLPLRQAIALMETLARAVHQAHEKNIVHRNLKPASILLAMQNDRQASPPFCILHSAFCIPKITDFGLARRPVEGDASDVELQGELPCYLAPEQAWGRAKEIGPATDIYALGAILFELLAGHPPFREATATETLDAIQCREPPSLTRLRSGVPNDLDAICRKCLAKQPRRRYASALDLADDLRRCAAGLSIKARTPGNAERLGKWLRRHWRGVALVLLGLCLGGALMGLIETDRDGSSPSGEISFRQTISRLEADLREARQHQTYADYLRYLLLAERAADDREKERGLQMLERCPPEMRHWEWDYLRGRLRDAEQLSRFSTKLPITSMDVSRDGQYVAVGESLAQPNEAGESKGAVEAWDLTKQDRFWHCWRMAGPVRSVAFSPDDAYLAMVSTTSQRGRKSTLEVRHLQSGVPLFAPRLFTDCTPTSLVYSEDSRNLLAIADDGKLRVLQARKAMSIQTHEIPFPQIFPRGLHAQLLPMRAPSAPDRLALISPDGGQILVLPDFQRRDAFLDFRHHDDSIYYALAYDRQNEKLAAGGTAKAILLWDLRFRFQAPRRLLGHTGAVHSLSFSSDGKRLASCGADGIVRIWDPEQGIELLSFKGYSGASTVLFRSLPSIRLRAGIQEQEEDNDALVVAHNKSVTVIQPPPHVGARPRR